MRPQMILAYLSAICLSIGVVFIQDSHKNIWVVGMFFGLALFLALATIDVILDGYKKR